MTNTAQDRCSLKMSIVVPCYKSEQYLPKCLDSLIAQTLDGIEIIVVNDGSPDSCYQIMCDYERRYPSLVRTVSRENGGLYAARWSGVDVARGEYVGFVDSDDWVEPYFAECLYTAAKREDADVAVCGFMRTDLATGKVLSDEMGDARPCINIAEDPGRLVEVNSAAWNKCYRREVLQRMYRIQRRITTLEDVMTNLCAYLESQGRVAFAGRSAIHYMVHADSMINTLTLKQLEEVKSLLLELRAHYEATQASKAMLAYMDAYVFLHLGVAMSSRLSNNPDVNLGDMLRGTTAYLDEHFPTWRHSPYINMSYARSQDSGALKKLVIAQRFYKMHLMGPFLACYRFAINTLHIDIKW